MPISPTLRFLGAAGGDRFAPSAGSRRTPHPARLRPVPGREAAAAAQLGAVSRAAGGYRRGGVVARAPGPFRLPAQAGAGWISGPILCSPATLDLCRLLLLDSAHLQEADADYLNRHGLSRHQPALPLYTVADAQRDRALRPVDFDTATDLPGGCGVQLTPAGHILGAAIVQIRHPGGRLVFSGDLGRYGDPLMPPPGGGASRSSDRRVHLWQPQAQRGAGGRRVGSRHHAHGQARRHRGDTRVRGGARAGAALHLATQAGGAHRPRPAGVPGQPDGQRRRRCHLRHAGDQRLSAADARAAFGVATYVTEVEQSKALDSSPMPKIIVSASGMPPAGA